MRAVVCRELGPLDQGLVVDEVPDPHPPPGGVVVRVEAAGANFVDGLMAQGQYQARPRVPYVPGGEVAGTVEEVADGVTDVSVGDRIVALCGFGGFAEKVAVPLNVALQVPDTLASAVAATFIQGYCTAQYALHGRGRHQPGESVLVLGGGGGIGLAAIDLAQSCGARVVATGSTPEKRAAASAAGAEVVLPPDADLKDQVRRHTGGGVDLVVDPVGGDLAEPALRSLRGGGRYLVIGFSSGVIPKLPLNQVLLRNRSVLGVDWGAWAFSHPEEQRDMADRLMALVADGKLHPPEPAVRPLGDTAEVLQAFLDRRSLGKVAIAP